MVVSLLALAAGVDLGPEPTIDGDLPPRRELGPRRASSPRPPDPPKLPPVKGAREEARRRRQAARLAAKRASS